MNESSNSSFDQSTGSSDEVIGPARSINSSSRPSESPNLNKTKKSKDRASRNAELESKYSTLQLKMKTELHAFISRIPEMGNDQKIIESDAKINVYPVFFFPDILESPETYELGYRVIGQYAHSLFEAVNTYEDVLQSIQSVLASTAILYEHVCLSKHICKDALNRILIAETNSHHLLDCEVPDISTATKLLHICDVVFTNKQFSNLYQMCRAQVVQHIHETLLSVKFKPVTCDSTKAEAIFDWTQNIYESIFFYKNKNGAINGNWIDSLKDIHQQAEAGVRIAADTFVEAFVSLFRTEDQKNIDKCIMTHPSTPIIQALAQQNYVAVNVSRKLRHMSSFAYEKYVYTGPGNEKRLCSLEDRFFDSFKIRECKDFLAICDLSFYAGNENENLDPILLSMVFDATKFEIGAPRYNLRVTDALFGLVIQLLLPRKLGGYKIEGIDPNIAIILDQLSPSTKAGPRARMLAALYSSYNNWQWPHASLWLTSGSELITETIDPEPDLNPPPTFKLDGSVDTDPRKYHLHEGWSLCELEIKNRTLYCSLKQYSMLQKLVGSSTPIEKNDLVTSTEALVLHDMVSKSQGLIRCAHIGKQVFFAFDPTVEFEDGLSLVSARLTDIYIS